MSQTRHTKTLIIGSGPAGYTAAVYASRAMLEPIYCRALNRVVNLRRRQKWKTGQEMPKSGPDLMIRMESHAIAMGAEVIADIILTLI